MALSVDDLFTPLTEDQVLESMLSTLETLGVPARSWRTGGALRVIVRVCARTYAGFTAVMAAFIKSGFLETAEGAWLTLLARYVYGVERRTATFAREDLLLDNLLGGGLYTKAARTVLARAPSTGKLYTNVDAFTINPGESFPVLFEAVEAGSASSAAVGTITAFVDDLDGVGVTNLNPFVGIDDEDDPTLRQACKDRLASLSPRGPRGAYAWAARIATRPSGDPVNINRTRVSSSSSTGVVAIYCAAPSGAPIPTDLDYVRESVEAVARPETVTATVAGANPVTITRTLTVWARRTDGLSASALKALVETAFVRENPIYPLGGIAKPPSSQGYVYADFIAGVAKAAHPSIFDVDGQGSDVALTASDVAVFAITANVRLVEVP
jgi:hypothetical protein